MLGVIIAFKEINYSDGILGSPWVGFKNFRFLFATSDAFVITRNTLGYNTAFIIMNIIVPVSIAIALNELRNKWLPRIYQAVMLFPYFISMVVTSYLVLALLSHNNGFFNSALMPFLGKDPVNWYDAPVYWPFFLVAINVWKTAGYTSIIYLASLAGIDPQLYEAIAIDGGGKWAQIRYISIPMLRPIIIVMTLLSIGKIFNSDFGLFFQVPLQSGTLFPVTNVIDTYVYRSLILTNDLGMAAAAGFYQAIVGLILVLTTNTIVKKINPANSLF
ncbi:MAG: ABC transporter permease subunit [Spirochaetales bacterium]|nr:ABC transporter permease subunit [Spirochaetales bacterium]